MGWERYGLISCESTLAEGISVIGGGGRQFFKKSVRRSHICAFVSMKSGTS